MQRYDTYKDSGVKWLGEIPSHWESIPLKKCFISSESGLWGDDPKHNDDDAICIRVADFDYSKFSIKTSNLTLRNYGFILSENKKLKKGDLLLEKSGGGELFPVGRVVRFNLDFGKTTCSNFIQKLSPSQKYCSSFLCYLFSSMYTKKVNGLYFNQTTGIQNLKIKEYLNQTVFLPPLKEQTAIANYLDTATAKIDAAIAQQQKMIDLLNERKQIIINRAVTKGLNPNAKMKDSGVEWIGEVPEGWDIVPIKRYNSVYTGKTPSTANEYYFEDGDINWYTPGDLNQFNLNDSERKVTERAKREDACLMFPSNTVYLVGIGGTIGKVSYSEQEASCNQQINAIVPQKDFVYYKFLAYYLRISKTQIYQNANLSTLPIINQDRTRALLMLMPPLAEQKTIVEYLENAAKPLDNAIEAANNQISLLQERKQIIINEVVTGKVRVV